MSRRLQKEEEMDGTWERDLVIIGPGERLEELSAALSGLLGRAPGGGARLVGIEDLAQLLLVRTESGRLLLDGDRVPLEDIGILRRFLEGRPAWSLAVLGDNAGAERSRALLDLTRSRFVAWPPNLDDLRALAGLSGSQAPPPALPTGTRPAAEANGQAARGDETWDLGTLLDDLLVGRSATETAAEYALGTSPRIPMEQSRSEVAEVFDGFLTLADACAGPDARVQVSAVGERGQAVVEILFPPGDLTDGDLPALLQDAPFEGSRKLRAATESARAATRTAHGLAGSAVLEPSGPGELRLEVRLPLSV
ncbi:MAG: hypothetical protein AAF682_03745 [Planctomycetota bacterium]